MNTKYKQPPPPDVETDEFDTEEGSYAPPIPIQRKSRNQPPPPPVITSGPDAEAGRPRRNRWGRPMRFVLVGALFILAVIMIWNQVVIPWWNSVQDQWNYGSSRVTQMDANVGHGGEEHFVAEYYKGAIVVIEILYANMTNTHVYTIPGMEADNMQPVILLSTTKDAKTGLIDLVVQVEGTNFQELLYNTGSAFSTTEG